MNYPMRQQTPNGWQVAGQALQGAGEAVGQFSDKQAQMRALFQQMVEKREAAILAQKQQEQEMEFKAAEDARRQAEADRKSAAEENRKKFQEGIQGKVISATLAKDPSLAKSSKPVVPGGPTQAELDDLGNIQGMQIPNQAIGAQDSTAMMGAALDRQPTDMGNGRAEPTRDEILRSGLQYGQMDEAKKYADATAPDKLEKGADPATMARYYGDFLPQIAPLLKRLKNDPTVASDIAYMGEQQGLGGLDVFQKFIDNLKGGQPWNAATGQRLDLASKGQIFQQENALRDEYNKKTATFETSFTAFKKLSQALERNNPADAYSAIINYVRTLDPGSTVREAEERLARERAAGGPLGAFGQHLSNLKSGTLTDPIRKNLLEAGRGLVGAEFDSYKQIRKDYGGRVSGYRSRGYDINESAVLGEDYGPQYDSLMSKDIFAKPGVVAPAAKPAPQAGGSDIRLTGDKAKRLAELRAKAAQGTIK